MSQEHRHHRPSSMESEGAGEVVMASFLWALVTCALAYGVFNTLKTAAALFAG